MLVVVGMLNICKFAFASHFVTIMAYFYEQYYIMVHLNMHEKPLLKSQVYICMHVRMRAYACIHLKCIYVCMCVCLHAYMRWCMFVCLSIVTVYRRDAFLQKGS